MPYERSFALRQMAINAATFTDIGPASLPIGCNTIVVINVTATDILLRSDPANPASEITIRAGQQFELGTSPHAFNAHRFHGGVDPVAGVKSTSGNLTIVIESIV